MTANGAGRALIRIVSIGSLVFVLSFWLTFANQAHTYLPYKNVLTVDSAELELPR